MSFLDELERGAHEFGFHAALRQVEALFPDLPRFGEAMRPLDEPIRLGQDPNLGFAPAELSRFEQAGGRPGQLEVGFFGLFGPNGPLPLHLTEYARQRIRHVGDRTLSAFVNLFNHRMLLLFHRAWAQVEPAVHQDRPQSSRFEAYVGSLMGLGLSALRERDLIPDHAKLQYVGWLSNPVRSAEGLGAILADYFEVPVTIQEFQGEWLDLPESGRLQLGGPPEVCSLGRTTLLGPRVYSVQHRFRICFGPLSREDYSRFLPGSAGLAKLATMVRAYVGDEYAWDLSLRLREDAAGQIRLGGSERLSYNARLGKRGALADLVIDPFQRSSRRHLSRPSND